MTLRQKKNRAGKPVGLPRLELRVPPAVLSRVRRLAREGGFSSANAWAAALVTRAARDAGRRVPERDSLSERWNDGGGESRGS